MATPNLNKNNRKGAFEACFAKGLDLSEFASSPYSNVATASNRSNQLNDDNDLPSRMTNEHHHHHPPPPIKSAAAELLEIKRQEANLEQLHRQEEEQLQIVLEQRISQFKEKQQSTRHGDRSDSVLTNALMKMHKTDYAVTDYKGKHRKPPVKIRKQPLPFSSINGSSKGSSYPSSFPSSSSSSSSSSKKGSLSTSKSNDLNVRKKRQRRKY